MKQKKEPIVKDERTMLLDGKIAGELVLGMTLLYCPIRLCEIQYPGLRPSRLSPLRCSF